MLGDFVSEDLRHCSLLDVGCAAGLATDVFAEHFGLVVGVDLSAAAIRGAGERMSGTPRGPVFARGDGQRLSFGNESFDVVVCAQVYEHVADADALMAEAFRVLRTGGVCYFAANNRLRLWEPHHSLPLLSLLPPKAADAYVRLAGRGSRYAEHHRSFWGLQKLTRQFVCHDYTRAVLADSDRYGTGYMVESRSLRGRLASALAFAAPFALPGYIWLLEKPPAATRSARR